MSIFHSAEVVLEAAYRQDQNLSAEMLTLALALAKSRRQRPRGMIINALQGMNQQDRDAFLSAHSVPSDIMSSEIVEIEPLLAPDAIPGQSLAAVKEKAVRDVNRMVGRARGEHITELPGQQMLYMHKEREAVGILASVEGDYPLLSAEVGITADTLENVAQVILFTADLWTGLAAALETTRLGAIKDIGAAVDVAGVYAIVEAVSV
jgi:hypothetical protein